MQKNKKSLNPIIKWAGGKRQLLSEILPLIPKDMNRYIEPFVGGGAVAFSFLPENAILNDFNRDLMNLYQVVRDYPMSLIERLKEHASHHSEAYFYTVRSWDREEEEYMERSSLEKAARMVYLNKTCYNGLYRVNQSGQFNAPYGRYKNPNIVDEDGILALSSYLSQKDILLRQGDYKEVLQHLKRGDFVYLDPPYLPVSKSSSFVGYTENGFSIKQQKELKNQCDCLNEKGVSFLLSNADHPFLRDLYQDYIVCEVKASRAINSKGEKRGKVSELLVRNYSI